jgi:hypothetical protein
MAIKAKKQKKLARRIRTGISGVPIEKGFGAVLSYFQTEVGNKDISNTLKAYIKEKHKKSINLQYIMACPEYKFTSMPYQAATAFWLTHASKKDDTDQTKAYSSGLSKWMSELIAMGKELYESKLSQEQDSNARPTISPMVRLQRKISNTIMQDLLDLEDKWIEGENATLDLYQEFKRHGLPASATKQVRMVVEGWLLDYADAYNKTCPDAVEGYSHLSRKDLKHRVTTCEAMLSDLDRLQSAAKATRTTRVKQPKAADKQVTKLKYKKEDTEYKIVSITPLSMIGAHRLYTFNTKTRVITEFVTNSAKGFEVSGSTLKNIDTSVSRCTRLRKPDAFIPIVLKKTTNQIDKEWKTLTTKTTVPNGRMNEDTILLKVMDK